MGGNGALLCFFFLFWGLLTGWVWWWWWWEGVGLFWKPSKQCLFAFKEGSTCVNVLFVLWSIVWIALWTFVGSSQGPWGPKRPEGPGGRMEEVGVAWMTWIQGWRACEGTIKKTTCACVHKHRRALSWGLPYSNEKTNIRVWFLLSKFGRKKGQLCW